MGICDKLRAEIKY